MWNYRLVYDFSSKDPPVSIREVYYNDNDEIDTWSAEEVIYGDIRDEVIQCYLEMAEAFLLSPLELVEVGGKLKLVPYHR